MRKLLAFVLAVVGYYSGLQAQSMCGGGSATIVPTSTLTNPTYVLNPGNFSPNQQGNFVVSPPATTVYTVVATSGTTTNSYPVTVTVNPQPNVAPTFTQSTCTNTYNAVNLNLTFVPASSPGYTITWNPLPGSVTSPTQFSATALTPGPYTVNIVAAGGCATTLTFAINPQPAPANFTVTPFGSTHYITCVTSSVELTANNANHTYTWSGASFAPVIAQSITLTASHLGTLGVIGTNTISGCTSSYTFQLIQNISAPSSTLSSTNINITCAQPTPPTLSVTSSPSVNIMNYIYSPQGAVFSAASYTAIYTVGGGPGNYTHTAVDISNGCSVTKVFVVTSSDYYPSFGVSSTSNFTVGCSTTSITNVKIENGQSTIPPGGGPVTFTLIGPGTSPNVASGNLSGNSNYTVTLPGTYTVIVRDNNNGCDSRLPVTVLQNTFQPQFEVTVPQQILDCRTTSIVLAASSTVTPVGYNWGFQGVPGNQAGETFTVNTIPPGSTTPTLINTYTLTTTNNVNRCISTTIIPIYQNVFVPNILISSQTTPSLSCFTNTVILSNQSVTRIPPTTGFPTGQPVIGLLWEGPSPQTPLQVSSTYTGGVTGVYTLTGRDQNNGCIGTGTFHVGENRVFPTLIPDNRIIDCGVPFITLTPTISSGLSTSPLSYSWTGSNIVGTNSLATFAVTSPGTYSLVVTNTVNGCVSRTISAVRPGSLTAGFTPDVTQGYAPLTVVFNNNSTSSTGSGSVFSTWHFGNGKISGTTTPTGSFVPGPISGSLSPTTVFNHPGIYKVTVYSTKGACLDTAYAFITVDIPSNIEVPNVFTPNNDGTNDIFFLKANNLVEINMSIYDRWGHLVYDVTSTSGNVEWDGKNPQGTDSAEGTYFYVLKAMGKDGTSYDKKGTISLLR